MSTDLRDELTRLAGTTPPAVAPPDLWQRGVRRQRRVRALTAAGSAAVVLAVVLASTVGWDSLRTREVQPAGTDRGAIPTRLETPSKFTATTADGPIGPLAVIAGAEKAASWLGGSRNGLVGVSADTGEYRFLDLPDQVDTSEHSLGGEQAEPALSPDGRHVAYWLRQADHADRVGGFAVCDTVTGAVTRHPVASELGLWAEGMAWTDPDTLLVGFGEVTEIRRDGGAGEGIRTRAWQVSSDRLLDLEGTPDLWDVSPQQSGFAVSVRHGIGFWQLPSGERVHRVTLARHQELQGLGVDPSGRTVVAAPQTQGLMAGKLLVGRIEGSRAKVSLAPVRTEVEHFDFVGWQDAQHVLVRGAVPGSQQRDGAVYSVDVTSGDARLVVREARESWGAFPQYATDLWQRATVDRPGPDRVLDPRLRVAGALAVALLAGLVVLGVRRRRARA